MLKFLGLSADTSTENTIPIWQGVRRKHKVIANLVSIALAIAVLFLTHWLLADFPSEGYLPHVPWNAAAAILLLSTLIAERGLIRNTSTQDSGH